MKPFGSGLLGGGIARFLPCHNRWSTSASPDRCSFYIWRPRPARRTSTMREVLKNLLSLGALVMPLLTLAQTATIRGFVYDQGTGEPMIFTNVSLVGTAMGVATDVNGYFSISKVPPGPYTLTVT